MKDGFFSMVQFTFGPSLGVNQMSTKRNGHAPISEHADFFDICPKYVVLRQTLVWPFSCLLLCSCPPFPKKTYKYIIIKTFLCHGPLPFSTIAPILPLPPQTLLDHVNGECRPWDDFMVHDVNNPLVVYPRDQESPWHCVLFILGSPHILGGLNPSLIYLIGDNNNWLLIWKSRAKPRHNNMWHPIIR
jgi:hypothetical protein